MKKTLVSKEGKSANLTFECTKDEFAKACMEAYEKNKSRYSVDGFRKGKAPKKIIEAKFGKDVFFDEAVNLLIKDEYPKALDEFELDPVDMPKVDFEYIDADKGFKADITVEIMPEVTLKKYKDLEVEKVNTKILKKNVDEAIELERKKNARIQPVDRKAKNGDIAVIDYEGFKDGVVFEGGTAKGFSLKLGSKSFIDGFEEGLVGTKAGDEKDLNLTFPKEYHAEDLAGADVVFKVKVNEIKEEEIPKLDDDFVKEISEYDTVKEYRDAKKEELKKSAKASDENKMKTKAIEMLIKENPLDVPDGLIKMEVDSMISEMAQNLQMQGVSLDDYVKMMGSSKEDLKLSMKPDAESRVKTRMLVEAVVKAENIEANEDEVKEKYKLLATQYGVEEDKIEDIIKAQGIEYIKKDIAMQKALDFLYENTKFIDAVKKEEKEENNTCSCGCEHDHDHDHSH